jgi:hypothetical protein
VKGAITKTRNANYKDNPESIVDLAGSVVQCLTAIAKAPDYYIRAAQLHEISLTIARLEGSGTEIPSTLRDLEAKLSAETHGQEKAIHQLEALEQRLSLVLTDLRSQLRVIKQGTTQKTTKRTKRRVKTMSPRLLRLEIRRVLREMGGAAQKADIIEAMRQRLELKFREDDLVKDSAGNEKWTRNLAQERERMIKDGILRTGSPRGLWELRRPHS